MPNSRCIVEDIIVYSNTYEKHVEAVRELFKRASEHNVAINTGKIVFVQPAVTFGGYQIDSEGFRPDPELLRAIREFPLPCNRTDIKSFFGLCQQVSQFSDRLSAALDLLSQLLKKDYSWEWTTQHEDAFNNARMILSETCELAFYDAKRPTSLHVDASRPHGLGFILKQRDPKKNWQIVQAGSRFLLEAESRYAMIELECLGAAWAMQRCRQFLESLPTFDLVTDHKPLMPILNSYAHDKLDNPRLLRLRLKMQRYSFIGPLGPRQRESRRRCIVPCSS